MTGARGEPRPAGRRRANDALRRPQEIHAFTVSLDESSGDRCRGDRRDPGRSRGFLGRDPSDGHG